MPREIQLTPGGAELALLVDPLGAAGARVLLGLAGAPGAGKSRLAAVLAHGCGGVVVPMDGFHLADVVLRGRGLLDRKGAPETFDPWGYAALLGRLRAEADRPVYAPGFDRDLEQPLAGAVPVPPEAGLVLTEGNYLLLDRPGWREARSHLDAVWFVRTDDALRRRRLVTRHIASGKSPAAAAEWVARVDEPNAALVAATANRADLVLDLSAWDGRSDGSTLQK